MLEMCPVVLTTTSDETLNPESEESIKTFIDWCLAQSYSKDYTPNEALHLLDLAWKTQKTLWRRRENDQA